MDRFGISIFSRGPLLPFLADVFLSFSGMCCEQPVLPGALDAFHGEGEMMSYCVVLILVGGFNPF